MRVHAFTITIAIVSASAALGQSSPNEALERVFHFTTVPARQGFEQAATVLRTVGGIRELSIGAGSGTLSVRGRPAEIAAAEWLFSRMDQPANPAPAARQIRDSALHEYRFPGGKDDVMRVNYLTNTDGGRGVQELLTTLRIVAGIQRIFPFGPPVAIAFRGTTGEIALADWLIRQLDRPSGQQTSGAHEYSGSGSGKGGDRTRVFYPEYLRTTEDLDTVLVKSRTDLHITKVFACGGPGAVIFRGTADEMDRAARLVAALDHPPK